MDNPQKSMDWRFPEVQCKRIKGVDFEKPKFESNRAVARDVRANIDAESMKITHIGGDSFEITKIKKGLENEEIVTETKKGAPVIGTGFMYAIPEGYEMTVRTRSGDGIRLVGIVNAPGTIDQDFRGELGVILAPWYSNGSISFDYGDRIAQIVVSPVSDRFSLGEVDELPSTDRGSDGFGSTGKK